VLAAAKIAVVLQRAFVEFVSTIVEWSAVIAECLHLVSGEWLKIAQDRQILVEDLHGIDAADGRGNGEAHGVRKCFGGSERALRDELARAAPCSSFPGPRCRVDWPRAERWIQSCGTRGPVD